MQLRRVVWGLCAASAWALVCPAPGASAQDPFRSFHRLVTGNGHAVASYDRVTRRVDTFLEHPYRFHAPRNDPPDLCFAADESRDLAYDVYFGVRADGSGQWLSDAPLDEAGYVVGTNVIEAVQHTGPGRALEVRTSAFMPYGIEQPVLVMVARVQNVSSSSVDASIYALANFHLGAAGGGREPSADGEEVAWDAARGVFYEYGPSQGTVAYVPLTDSARQTASTGASSAYQALLAGSDLDGVRTTSGPTSDVSPGLQWAERTLGPGEVAWAAFAVVWALDEDAAPDVDAVRTWAASRAPEAILADERAAWDAWHTTPPAGLGASQRELWLQSAVILRMGQVREPGPGFGQILASLPPGLGHVDAQWNISWVRDMAYAVAGLARSGHLEEARDALAFQVSAPRGRHTAEVGMPYRISITRYFGNGEEESDCNADGPNIEFDGFGLFLWSLGEWLRSGGDEAELAAWWPTIRDEVADVLVALIDDTGAIAPDSSIWEVHWNGKQKHFTYTSLAAVRGLCEAASVAETMGDDAKAAEYRTAAEGIRAALLERHVDERGAFAQSQEDLSLGYHYVDAATVEAINWGIVHPRGRMAQATLSSLLDNLTVETGIGLMRNDDGGWYDSQEWVFVDFRLLPALGAAGREPRAAALLAWLEGQALENDHQLSELHEAATGAYAGSIPMVGFGAGAYLIALGAEGVAEAACGAYPDGPLPGADGGVPGEDAGPGGTDAGPGRDAGAGGTDAGTIICPDAGCEDDPTCSCRVPAAARARPATFAWLLLGLGVLLAWRRR